MGKSAGGVNDAARVELVKSLFSGQWISIGQAETAEAYLGGPRSEKRAYS
ncbi:MAG: hypothetical protein P1U77_26235 [Rubripirellula sp.]|jgi:hypothetical protein|nr:hypothetical protein [Rubripirellula sp.]